MCYVTQTALCSAFTNAFDTVNNTATYRLRKIQSLLARQSRRKAPLGAGQKHRGERRGGGEVCGLSDFATVQVPLSPQPDQEVSAQVSPPQRRLLPSLLILPPTSALTCLAMGTILTYSSLVSVYPLECDEGVFLFCRSMSCAKHSA